MQIKITLKSFEFSYFLELKAFISLLIYKLVQVLLYKSNIGLAIRQVSIFSACTLFMTHQISNWKDKSSIVVAVLSKQRRRNFWKCFNKTILLYHLRLPLKSLEQDVHLCRKFGKMVPDNHQHLDFCKKIPNNTKAILF